MTADKLRRGPKLGIDVGTVRVGLAASDPDGILATPVRTLTRDTKKNFDIRIVVREAAERGVTGIYVGLPRTLRGAEGSSAEMARAYAAVLLTQLADAGLEVPVWLVDERLSSVSAHQALRAAGMSGRDQRKVVDQAAAAGILQHALEAEKFLGRPAGVRVPAPEHAPAPRNQQQAEKDGVISSSPDPGRTAP